MGLLGSKVAPMSPTTINASDTIGRDVSRQGKVPSPLIQAASREGLGADSRRDVPRIIAEKQSISHVTTAVTWTFHSCPVYKTFLYIYTYIYIFIYIIHMWHIHRGCTLDGPRDHVISIFKQFAASLFPGVEKIFDKQENRVRIIKPRTKMRKMYFQSRACRIVRSISVLLRFLYYPLREAVIMPWTSPRSLARARHPVYTHIDNVARIARGEAAGWMRLFVRRTESCVPIVHVEVVRVTVYIVEWNNMFQRRFSRFSRREVEQLVRWRWMRSVSRESSGERVDAFPSEETEPHRQRLLHRGNGVN